MQKLRKPLIIGIIICSVLSWLIGLFIKDELLSLAIDFEITLTLFWTFFIFLPLSWAKTTDESDAKILFLKMFIGRIIILIICDLFVTPYIFILDFIAVFIGFIVAAILSVSKFYKKYVLKDKELNADETHFDIPTCPYCGKYIKKGDKFCKSCGSKLEEENKENKD